MINQTYYALTLWIVALGVIVLAAYVGRRRSGPGIWPLVVLLIAAALWSAAYAVELISTALAAKVFWAKVQYLGIVTLSPAWFAFALQYPGRGSWLTRSSRNLSLLILVPLVTLILVWTNEAHGLIWSETSLDPTLPSAMLQLDYGLWFWIHSAYAYLLLFLGSVRLVTTLLQSTELYRWQVGAALLGTSIPWVANLLYVVGLTPAYLDPTPFAFTLAGLAYGLSLTRFRLLAIIPVARQVVVDGLSDCVIVCDTQNRVADLNPTAERLFGQSATQLIGRPAAEILCSPNYRVDLPSGLQSIRSEIPMTLAGVERCYDLRITPLLGARKQLIGRLVVLHDVTERKRNEAELRQARDELQLVVTKRTEELEQATRQLKDELAARQSAERRYRTLFEEAPVMYALTRNEGGRAIIADCNQLFCSTLGHPKSAVLRRPLTDFFIPDSRRVGEPTDLSALDTTLLLEERQLLTAEGQTVEALLQATAELDADGVLIGTRVTFLDITHRKQAERRFEALFESAPDAMLIVNRNGQIRAVNGQAERMFGYSREDLLYADLHMLMPSRFRKGHMGHLAGFFAEPRLRPMGIGLDTWARRTDGSDFPVEISLSPLQTEEGLLVSVAVRDVTDRAKAEAAVRESEQTYRALFEKANDAIFLLSLDGIHLEVNQKAADMLHYQRDELVGMSYRKIVDPSEASDSAERLSALLRWETLPVYERTFRTKRGEAIPVEINVALVRDDDDKPRFIQSIVRDISDRKRVERALRESEAKFRNVIESSPLGIHMYQLGLDGRLSFVEANPAADAILGVDHSKLVGKTVEEAFPGIAATELPDRIRQVAEDGEPWGTDQLPYDNDQISGAFEVRAFQASPGRAVVTFTDVTERILAQQEQIRLLKEIGQQQDQLRELAMRLSDAQEAERKELARELHDQVGQSLSALDFNLSLMRGQLPKGSTVQERIGPLLESSLNLLAQTADRIRDVMANLRPPVLDDYGLLAALKWYGTEFVSPRGVAVAVTGHEPEPRLAPAVELVLFRIAQEALTNVLKHAEANTVALNLHTDMVRGTVRLVIEDDGIGFEPARQPGPKGGHHWGLVTMNERALGLGGRCHVASHPGTGTRIEVEVPR